MVNTNLLEHEEVDFNPRVRVIEKGNQGLWLGASPYFRSNFHTERFEGSIVPITPEISEIPF